MLAGAISYGPSLVGINVPESLCWRQTWRPTSLVVFPGGAIFPRHQARRDLQAFQAAASRHTGIAASAGAVRVLTFEAPSRHVIGGLVHLV